MSKPMYCPMSFNRDAYFANGNKVNNPVECISDCAWAVTYDDGHGIREYFCGITQGWFLGSSFHTNSRPLKDDND